MRTRWNWHAWENKSKTASAPHRISNGPCRTDSFSCCKPRPITTLYPLPQGLPAEPLKALFSFAAIQGIFAPLTPLGIDTLKLLFATGAELFNTHVDQETQTILYEAGQRLWGQLHLHPV